MKKVFNKSKIEKNTRRNVFDIMKDDMRSNTFVLAEEGKGARNQTKPPEREASKWRGDVVGPTKEKGGSNKDQCI